jgi:6-phosphofructokinase
MNSKKRLGILTSGGDCAGLNAVISSVVKTATQKGWEVYGIHNGTDGITNKPHSFEVLTVQNFSDTPWPRLSGSYLGSLNKGVKMESLEEIYKNSILDVSEIEQKHPKEIIEYINLIGYNCEKKKGLYTVLTTLLYYKHLNGEQDIRLHQTYFQN